MRLLNEETDKKMDNIIIYLTMEEAMQMRAYLSQIIENPQLQHLHFSSSDYQKEITICLYDEKKLQSFDSRSKKLIQDDE